MTRHSKRELERALDDLTTEATTPGDVPDRVREAFRAALAYRYANYGSVAGDPDGDSEEMGAFLRDASDHVEEPYATALRELIDARRST
ncbi:hypothetical protein [Halobacterium jilantaiense]|uniref:Uncharacterized protein n=1 Tax=Halobacterium jilantaiense TaxID=355548 RepID=A0A1I0Q0T5_9EURY|nr:hypothetical protein [Halobacterium jilantaiense]SEW20488.1 hypothetical protein SAMN04487945_2160 [Halobacterium jilantaiense]